MNHKLVGWSINVTLLSGERIKRQNYTLPFAMEYPKMSNEIGKRLRLLAKDMERNNGNRRKKNEKA